MADSGLMMLQWFQGNYTASKLIPKHWMHREAAPHNRPSSPGLGDLDSLASAGCYRDEWRVSLTRGGCSWSRYGGEDRIGGIRWRGYGVVRCGVEGLDEEVEDGVGMSIVNTPSGHLPGGGVLFSVL